MSCPVIFDREQGVGTCTACGKNFECGAVQWQSNPRPTSDVQERFMSKQEVYHSSTLGPIPLSFTGRRLMQNLREAFQELLTKRTEAARRGEVCPQSDWEMVSRTRGELAQYISKLERRAPQSMSWHDPEPLSVLARRYSEGFKPEPDYRCKDLHKYEKRYLVRDIQPSGKSSFVCMANALTMEDALNYAMKQYAKLFGHNLFKRSDFEVRLLED